MERHLKILGWLWIIFSAVVVSATMAGTILLLTVADDEKSAGELLFLGLGSLPGIVGGYGLLRRRSWARILVMILAVITLFSPGVILAAYTLWVLLRSETGRLLAGGSEP